MLSRDGLLFLDTSPGKQSIHLRCFDHAEEDVKRELRREGVDGVETKRICSELFGSESHGIRNMGLVDYDDPRSFDGRYEIIAMKFPSDFVKWLESKVGRARSLTETMKKCMLKPVRTAAGLGNPPNKWVNNTTESLHSVIKEELGYEALDAATFLERVKERVFDQQLQEMIRGIHGLGEYRLDDRHKHHSVSPIQWGEMSPEQRKALTEKVLHGKISTSTDCVESTYNLSVALCDAPNMKLPLYTLKHIWGSAELILCNYQIQELIGGNFCVPDVDFAYTVKPAANFGLKCTCTQNSKTDGLCQHVVAVAEKYGYLSEFLTKYCNSGNNVNRIVQHNVPDRAGDKPKQRKPRRGRNNQKKVPITQFNGDLNISNEVDPDVDFMKECRFTEYFHNNEMFKIIFLNDKECIRAKSCISCKITFPKHNPASPDCDIIVVHCERYERPLKDANGKFLRMTISNNVGRKFYCAKKACILRRHPYFWKGMVEVGEDTRKHLTAAHVQYLADELHFHI